jgi:hypothetical protein
MQAVAVLLIGRESLPLVVLVGAVLEEQPVLLVQPIPAVVVVVQVLVLAVQAQAVQA